MIVPEGLGERGAALWQAVTSDRTWDAAGLVLVAEACRAADRLEQLDRLLRGDIEVWARLEAEFKSQDRRIVLALDDALAEARQQQGTLLQLVKMLGLGKATSAPSGPQQEDPLDELVRQWAAGGSGTPPL